MSLRFNVCLGFILAVLSVTSACPLENAAFGSPCASTEECGAGFVCAERTCIPDRLASDGDGGVRPIDDGGIEPEDGGSVEPEDGGDVVEPDPAPAPSAPIIVTPPNDEDGANFGESVALSGTTLVVGAPDIDRVFVYRLLGEGVDLIQEITPQSVVETLGSTADIGPAARFGEAVALDADVLVIGAPFGEWSQDPSESMGQAFICRRQNAVSDFECDLQIGGNYSTPFAYFGTSVAIGRGPAGAVRVAVGEPGAKENGVGEVRQGAVSMWTVSAIPLLPEGTVYSPTPNLAEEQVGAFGERVAFGPSGDRLAVAAPGENIDGANDSHDGRVHVFTRNFTGPFAVVETISAPEPLTPGTFGAAVAFDGAGRLCVGHTTAGLGGAEYGSVFVFSPTLSGAPVEIIQPSANQHFGNGLATVGTSVIVGAARDRSTFIDVNVPTGVYAFERDTDSYTERALPALTGLTLGDDNRFGFSVAADINSVVVGAPRAQVNANASGAVVIAGR